MIRLAVLVLSVVLLGGAWGARAADDHPLRPPDTSSPRSTLEGFIHTTNDLQQRLKGALSQYAASDRMFPTKEERAVQRSVMRDAPRAMRYLDLSGIPPVLRETLTIERMLLLKEILERIELPPAADIPDRAAMAAQSAKRWRVPDTEIDIVQIESGPRAGEYLFSAQSLERLPEFFERVRGQPYRPGATKELSAAYAMLSGSSVDSMYDAFLSSPIGLSVLIPPRWLLNLPDWAKVRVAGVTAWQWFGLAIGLSLSGLIIWASFRIVRPRADGEAPRPPWRRIVLPLAIIVVAGLLMPLSARALRIGGTVRVVIEYAESGIVFLGAAWLAMVAAAVVGETLVVSERLAARSLDSQLIRLGSRLIGLIAAIAILIQGGNELGFPAYSVLAGLGVGGLAVALAARETIANLIGSLLITLEKPFRVGHTIRLGGSEGTVEDVGFRSTRIRTPDNALMTIPSSTVVNSTVENLSLRPKRRQRFFVQLTYDTPREKLEELIAGIRQIIVDHPQAEDGTCHVRLFNFAESSLDILVIFHLFADDYAGELREREAVLLQIMALVEDSGAQFAFPTRTLHIEAADRGNQPPLA